MDFNTSGSFGQVMEVEESRPSYFLLNSLLCLAKQPLQCVASSERKVVVVYRQVVTKTQRTVEVVQRCRLMLGRLQCLSPLQTSAVSVADRRTTQTDGMERS